MDERICRGKLRNMTSVYLLQGNRILLLYRQGNSIVKNLWIASAGGHFEQDEQNDAQKCVLRELKEELSLVEYDISDLLLRYVTLRQCDGELRQNYYFFAKLKDSVQTSLHSNEGILKWFALNETDDLPMPFTARYVVDHYLKIGQFDRTLYGGIANDEGVFFQELEKTV